METLFDLLRSPCKFSVGIGYNGIFHYVDELFEVLAEVQEGDKADVDKAVKAATDAFK